MFRRFAGIIPGGALKMFECPPVELTTLLEVAWQSRAYDDRQSTDLRLPLGHPGNRSDLAPQHDDKLLNLLKSTMGIAAPDGLVTIWAPAGVPATGRTVLWDHLIYAYMIENTRIYEIFRQVLFEFLHGEKLGAPTAGAEHWLRNTEELFYHDPPPLSITNIASHIRPDLRATRRNAYWRMFGMDLNHGSNEGQPYSYIKADAYNNEFVTVFEELLREVWIAITNIKNETGPNPTDSGKMENLVENLHDMLISRRQSGNLSREEFFAVAAMSWFHLTVSFNESPIIVALRAEAASPEQRLFKVAQRVGLPAHGLSKSYFDIADAISRILIQIEASNTAIVSSFVGEGTEINAVQKTMNTIITHWSLITGRDMKAGKVAVR
ncbi:hypothetical protein EDS67_08545 [candidate division KSB1 bacterium]|nr:MAG: hypothetical protein EDS67_08545 [candidate division KSB1 bacterium]MBC6948582.1 hypothetical protein [candidate division KSB1 bacterium]MDL1873754.1 hypothetical protein [Cytophagia bacterium CHB2]